MKVGVKIAAVAYMVVMIGCVAAFLTQKSVVYSNHIRPGREQAKSPVVVELKDKQSGAVQEAELTFVNDSLVSNPLRMGNEIEEQFQTMLVALLATGIMLVFVAFATSRGAGSWAAGHADKPNAGAGTLSPGQLGGPNPMRIDDKDRVAILLQGQRTATDQMSAIKNNEMSWLKVFLIFYAAVIAWVIKGWFGPATGGTGSPTASPADLTLLGTAMSFSFIGTSLFASLFIHTRHSYYTVRERLRKFDQCLTLRDPSQWNGITFFPPEHAGGGVRIFRDWCTRTKPWSSFLTRLVYILGANTGIDYLGYLAFERVGSPQVGYSLAFWFGLNGALAVVVYVYDFVWFKRHKTS